MQLNPKILIAAAALLTLTAAAIPEAPVDNVQSTITAEFKQSGAVVEARFQKFTGSVHYDPKHGATSRGHIEIDMNSLATGSDASDSEVRSAAWLDSGGHPIAIFQIATIHPRTADRFQASGELNLKGKTENLVFPVNFSSAGGLDTFEGSVPVSRRKFGIGDSSPWGKAIDDEILIRFHIVAPAVR